MMSSRGAFSTDMAAVRWGSSDGDACVGDCALWRKMIDCEVLRDAGSCEISGGCDLTVDLTVGMIDSRCAEVFGCREVKSVRSIW